MPLPFNGDLLLDIWNSVGLQQFFSDHQVQAGGTMMFKSRDGSMFRSGFVSSFSISCSNRASWSESSAASRGMVKSLDEAAVIHNKAIAGTVKQARGSRYPESSILCQGLLIRDRLETLEVLGLDTWMDSSSMMKHYMSPEFQGTGFVQYVCRQTCFFYLGTSGRRMGGM